MVLRRTGERRRRVVMDEALQSPADSAPEATSGRAEPGKGKRSRQYSRNADRRNLPRCADFIPVSRVSVLGGWCLILTALLILNLAYGFLGSRLGLGLPVTSEVFGFGPRSLATWLQVTAWSTAGLVCLVIFSIRQHRSNDFRGTYRLWRWIAIGCVLFSLGTLVDFPGLLSEWSAALAGQALDRAGTAVIALQLLFVVAFGIRLLFELRSSRGASALALASGACGIGALLAQQADIGTSLASNREFVAGNLWLWTAALALMCLLAYARFVILHASGAIYVPEKSAPRKKKKRSAAAKSKAKAKAKKASKAAAEADEEAEEDAAWSADEEEEAEEEGEEEEDSKSKYSSPLSGKMKSQGRNASAAAEEAEDEDDAQEERSMAGLSRAERKRLKREQRQGRRAA